MVQEKMRIHMKTSEIVGLSVVVVVAIIIGLVLAPLIVALAAGALFGWAFWPTFWLALGFGLLVRSTTTINK